jgi:hypothetical protein
MSSQETEAETWHDWETHTDEGKNGHSWWGRAPDGSPLPPHPTYIANIPSLSTNNKPRRREKLINGMKARIGGRGKV